MKLTRTALAILGTTFLVGTLTAACGDNGANNDGGAGAPSDSGDDSGDDDGEPVGAQCAEPGGRECTGSASGIVCAEGSTAAVAFTCTTGEVCEGGTCVGQCEGGATECVGESAMRICADDGREWVSIACADGTTCQDGACLLPGGLVCTPGEKSCDGSGTAVTCKEDGSGYDETECPAETACVDGGCRGSVCTIGDTKCDDTATNWIYDWFEGSGEMPNLSVVYTCEDGTAWVPSPCTSDEANSTYCSYTDMNPADVAAIQANVAAYAAASWQYDEDYYYWVQDGGSESGYPEPQLPPTPVFEVPESTSAACVQPECDEWQWYFGDLYNLVTYPPHDRRDCGDPDEEADPWTMYSTCAGLPPYAPLTNETQECGAEATCQTVYGDNYESAACQSVSPDNEGNNYCYPGEITCNDGDTYQICTWYEGEGTYWNSYDCPSASACAESGSFPERAATCGGDPITPPT